MYFIQKGPIFKERIILQEASAIVIFHSSVSNWNISSHVTEYCNVIGPHCSSTV